MPINYQTFIDKLKKLPPEVADYLTCGKATDYSIEICEKYKLSLDAMGAHTNLICGLYFKEIVLADLIKTVMDTFKLDADTAKAMAIDIAGIKLLAINMWLGEDVKSYIKNLGADPRDYFQYILDLKSSIEKEKAKLAREAAEDEPEIVPEQKEKVIINEPVPLTIPQRKMRLKPFYKEAMATLLQFDGSDPELEMIDIETIDLLIEDTVFAEDLARAIHECQEILTTKQFILEDKVKDGTISNWIAYFIKLFGASYFDGITLTRFMTDSPNTKVLDEEEKKLVNRLLKTYRAIKFFPKTLEKAKPENWRIIPIEKTFSLLENGAPKGLSPLAPPIDENEININSIDSQDELNPLPSQPIFPAEKRKLPRKPLGPPQEKVSPKIIDFGQPKAPVAPVILAPIRPEISELQSMAASFPIDSLERKAIEDEIKKLEG
ncbi:MAG: hypothetical protein NT091_04830 [Candidatus Falkowbacteria bacterium]|nr:hypothetical protein [Candidatus Falkowbacteria bacterium]